MKKRKTISTSGWILMAIFLGFLSLFLFLPKEDKGVLIEAFLISFLTVSSFRELLPDSWLKQFRRKERNPLLEE